jgi:hypothetical protein
MLMSRNLFGHSLVAVVLIVASVVPLAQSAATQGDALLDLLLWGMHQNDELAAYPPELREDLVKVLHRSQAYRSQRPAPAGSPRQKMLRSKLLRYERMLVAVTDDSKAPALAAAYVDRLRPCYEWEGYHDCPEREASFAIEYAKANPGGPFAAFLPLLAAHRWLCTAEAYEYEKRSDDAARSRREYERALSTAGGSRAPLVRAAAHALQTRGSCRSHQ